MKKIQKEQVKLEITNWILEIDKKENLPKDIIALNFGLYEPYGMELTGSKKYDAEDDDWACEEDFEPMQRECPNIHISENLEWEVVLNSIADILKEIVSEFADIKLLNVKHITVGFSDGDLVVIK